MTYNAFLNTILPKFNAELKGQFLRNKEIQYAYNVEYEEPPEQIVKSIFEIFAKEVESFR